MKTPKQMNPNEAFNEWEAAAKKTASNWFNSCYDQVKALGASEDILRTIAHFMGTYDKVFDEAYHTGAHNALDQLQEEGPDADTIEKWIEIEYKRGPGRAMMPGLTSTDQIGEPIGGSIDREKDGINVMLVKP